MSRQKGQRGERDVCARFTAAGIPMKRNVEGSRGQLEGDGDNQDNLYVEVRHRETLAIPAWNREVAQKKGDKLGLLVYRRNREDWHVSIPLDDFLPLLKYANNWLEEYAPGEELIDIPHA
jgi:hypothetical protein